MIERREFITLLGGAAAAWPLMARAQQPPMRRVAFLHGLAESDPEVQARLAAFREGLRPSDGWKTATFRSSIGLPWRYCSHPATCRGIDGPRPE